MHNPSVLPYEYDFFNDGENFRTVYKKTFANIDKLGRYTTMLLQKLVEEDERFQTRVDEAEENEQVFDERATTFLSDGHLQMTLRELFHRWQEHMITDMESMRELRHYVVPLAGGKTDSIKDAHGSHIFLELTRLNYLLHYPQLLDEQENLAMYEESELSTEHYMMLHSLERTKHDSWIAIRDSFDISELYGDKEDPDEEVEEQRRDILQMWQSPILKYTQKQVEMIILFLTQQINDVPTTGGGVVVQEYRQIFGLVWLRIAQMLIEFHPPTVLNVEEHRNGPFDTGDENDVNTCSANKIFIAFCFYYMSELLRRFFYYDRLVGNVMVGPIPRLAALTASAKQWIHDITHSMGDDAFDDIYMSTLPIAYSFVGDDNFFKASRTAVHSRGACIAAFRPHLHKRYFSEAQITRDSVLNSTHKNYASRLFVLHVIDTHLRIHLKQVRWLNAVLVMNDGIEMSAYKLETNLVPVILQVFSSFWVYDQARVHICDNVNEAVGVWFWLLKTRYRSTLFDCNMSLFVNQVVPLLMEQEEQPTNEPAGVSILDMNHFEF
jgi:hypothetical protein